MDYFEKLVKQVALYIFLAASGASLLTGITLWAGLTYLPEMPQVIVILIAIAIGLIISFWLSLAISKLVTQPIEFLSKAILHVAPGGHQITAPDLATSTVGKALVSSLVLQVYQLASTQSSISTQGAPAPTASAQSKLQPDFILMNFPLPILVMNREKSIIFANTAALSYLGRMQTDVVGKNIYSAVDLAFSEEVTFDAWLSECQAKRITASRTWSHVRLMSPDQQKPKQFDMAAYYNKNNPADAEAIITFFDKTESYSKDDDALSFIALAVHELRTPLTILRGYIEVFEEELKGKLSPELDDFLIKMHASAQQLSTFISNILNVARVEENQLYLQLHEESWEQVLKSIIEDMGLRARVHNKVIEYNIQPGLPAVAIDKVSIYEVVSNLIDNAIKYSDKSPKIIIRSYIRDDGLIETTVQDYGIGIPSSVIGKLFEKFYRNHRSRASVGGTGLGLYLSKAIIKAHGGEIWVKSKENEGSTFGFSVQQYANLADNLKTADNQDIQRTAHGWIKNHSFYRR